jgi:hypothetical protein
MKSSKNRNEIVFICSKIGAVLQQIEKSMPKKEVTLRKNKKV